MESADVLKKLDLRFIVAQLQERDGMDAEQAARATDRYRQFLLTALAHPDVNLVPTKEVDAAWHCHMLNPGRYFEMCIGIFGRVLDHDPTVYRTQRYEEAWARTRALVPYGEEMPESPYGDGAGAGAGCFVGESRNAGAGCFVTTPAVGAGCFVGVMAKAA